MVHAAVNGTATASTAAHAGADSVPTTTRAASTSTHAITWGPSYGPVTFPVAGSTSRTTSRPRKIHQATTVSTTTVSVVRVGEGFFRAVMLPPCPSSVRKVL